jgi:sensor histidine kinase YesM
LLGLVFSVAARPALLAGEIMNGYAGHTLAKVLEERHGLIMGTGLANWIASALSFLLTYGFGLALITGLLWYQRYRDSQARFDALERSLSSTRLAALRMQLSPHTLFNLLHTIRGQIAWDPASAQIMVVQLGDVLRRLLAAGERDFSRLAEEFEFVRLYLELQRSRFSDRLSFEMVQLDEMSNLWVPSLILQPLVENAVAHGLAGHAGPVHVSVEAAVDNGVLTLRVTNPIAAERVAGAQGIGLRNVRERLVLHFPETATFRASAIDGDAWVAEIHMPLVHDARGGRVVR